MKQPLFPPLQKIAATPGAMDGIPQNGNGKPPAITNPPGAGQMNGIVGNQPIGPQPIPQVQQPQIPRGVIARPTKAVAPALPPQKPDKALKLGKTPKQNVAKPAKPVGRISGRRGTSTGYMTGGNALSTVQTATPDLSGI